MMNKDLVWIHPDAKIGENVTIDPFTVIHGDVEIGDNTWIGPHVTILDGARIGKNCRIFPGAVISAIPQDLKFGGEMTYAIIGDNTTIRECVTVNRGTSASGKTVVGSNCLLMAYAHIAHDCVIGNNCVIVNAVQMAGHVEVGDYAIIGGTSAIHQFSRIGAHAIIAGGSLVRKDIPPYVKAGREPVVYLGVNRVGLRRRGFTNEQIYQIHEIYRTLYLKGYNTTEALNIIESTFEPTPERDTILDFIRKSERGIIRTGHHTANHATEE